MAIFDFLKKSESFVGVDIGGGAIKVVELRKENDKPVLETYGVIEQSMDKGTLIEHPNILRDLLSTVMKKARVKSNKVMTALPSPLVFTAIINLTGLTEADAKNSEKLATAIQWEAKKIVPLPLEEMVLDWKLVKINKRGHSTTQEDEDTVKIKSKQVNVQVLLIGAAKTVVKKYMDVFKSLGYNLMDLDIESAALSRSLLAGDKSTVMIIDIGSTDTYISIIKNNTAVFERTVNFGGNIITRKFAESMKLEESSAGQFKIDMGFSQSKSRFDWTQIMKDELKMLVNEINYSFDLFRQDPISEKTIEKVILTGGVALMPGFHNYLGERLNKKVIIGDPWASIIYPDTLKPLIDEIGTRFGIAIGLALWSINS